MPRWARPKELWVMISRASVYTADKNKALDEMAKEVQEFLQETHMNQYGPQDWYDAGGAMIDKGNGKKKCLGIRTVSTTCPIGKMFYRRIWRGRPRYPRRPYHAHGFLSKRRRETPLAVERIMKHRMAKKKLNFAVQLYDVANAFPSPAHAELSKIIERMTPEEQQLMNHRHERARVELEEDKYHIGTGTTQGDSV